MSEKAIGHFVGIGSSNGLYHRYVSDHEHENFHRRIQPKKESADTKLERVTSSVRNLMDWFIKNIYLVRQTPMGTLDDEFDQPANTPLIICIKTMGLLWLIEKMPVNMKLM